jgi:hypothetical protein
VLVGAVKAAPTTVDRGVLLLFPFCFYLAWLSGFEQLAGGGAA